MMKLLYKRIYGLCILSIICILIGCNKKVSYGDAPYGDLPTSSIVFLSSIATPTSVEEGDTVSFQVKGIPAEFSNVKFAISQIAATPISYRDSTLRVVVPNGVTTGPLEIDLENGDHYIGPIVTIVGSISVSTAFAVGNGTNGVINDVWVGLDRNYVAVGEFSTYNGRPSSGTEFVNNIVKINSTNGAFINSYKGSNAAINTICYTVGGFYMVGGAFSAYNNHTNVISNITRLNGNLSLDTSIVNKISLIPTQDYYVDTVPTFATSFTGGNVSKIFRDPNSDSSLIVIGNFTTFQQYDYANSTASADAIYQVQMSQLARTFADGTLDTTYNYNRGQSRSYVGFNGFVNNAIQLSNGKIIVVGNFTSFNGVTTNRIAQLSTIGLADASFNSNGVGADNSINSITYNANTKKILIVGSFRNYNNVSCNGIALLNEDGSLDTTFKMGQLVDGNINYAGQLNNGLILVSGTFSSYEGFVRQGFMILNADGTLAAKGLNTTGAFVGQINKIIESTTTLGLPAVTIFGRFSIFDSKQFNNLVRIQFNP